MLIFSLFLSQAILKCATHAMKMHSQAQVSTESFTKISARGVQLKAKATTIGSSLGSASVMLDHPLIYRISSLKLVISASSSLSHSPLPPTVSKSNTNQSKRRIKTTVYSH